MNERIFVFREKNNSGRRPMMRAFPESAITEIVTRSGSQSCYLVVNGYEVEGSFDEVVAILGKRVDIV